MTKQLPWLTEPQKTTEVSNVGHPDYGVLQIPHLGSLTPNEELAIANYYMGLKGESLSEAKIEIATILLKFRIDPTWTTDDTLQAIQSFPLIEDLYDFANNERKRWVPDTYLVKFEGTEAHAAATDYAVSSGGVVASRPDIAGTYFIFANKQLVPTGFVIADADSTTVPEEPKK